MRIAQDLLKDHLSLTERLVVILHYYEELNMKEIGLVLDLPERKVRQMHRAAMSRIRSIVAG